MIDHENHAEWEFLVQLQMQQHCDRQKRIDRVFRHLKIKIFEHLRFQIWGFGRGLASLQNWPKFEGFFLNFGVKIQIFIDSAP